MSRSRIIALLLLAATTASTLVSCTTDSKEPPPAPTPNPAVSLVAELEPGDYRSTSLTSTTFDDFTAPMDSIDLEITMEDGYGFVIDNGCAVQTGSFLLENGVLTVTRVLTTLIGCTAPDGDAGSFVDELLSEPAIVTHSDDDLMWTNSFGEIVFTEAP